MRILVGAPARVPTPVFEAHLRTLAMQSVPKGVTLHPHYRLNGPDPATLEEQAELLAGFGGTSEIVEPLRPGEYAAGRTHWWTDEAFEYVARHKQALIAKALAEGYDYWWLVDADLLCDRRTLGSLLSVRAPVVSGCFWTNWAESSAHRERGSGPNLWMEHPNEGAMEPELVKRLIYREVVQVAGSGACTLFHRSAFEHGARYHPRFRHLPGPPSFWNAEDRVMALQLEARGIPQFVDPWPDIYHAYSPEQREEEALAEALDDLSRPPREFAMPSDRVSLLISKGGSPPAPIRARKGKLDPEIQALIWNTHDGPMYVGDTRRLGDLAVFLVDAKPVDMPFQYGRTGHWVDAPDIPRPPAAPPAAPEPETAPEWGEQELVEL